MAGERASLRVLVVGASGSVGAQLLRAFATPGRAAGTCHTRAAPGLIPLDAADDAAVEALFRSLRPRVVVCSAALADVDRCEEEPGLSHRANVAAPRTLAQACARHRVRLVHLSTDYVFDGRAGPYAEHDAPAPLNVYGRHKLEGERAVLAASPDALVVRTSVVYGGRCPEAPGAAGQVVHFLSRGEPLALSARHRGSPTHVDDLAAGVQALLRAGKTGTWHLGGPESCTRLEFGMAVANAFGLPPALLSPLQEDAGPRRAPRPLRCGLRVDRAIREVGYRPLSVADGLRRFAEDTMTRP
jgi:dTDP-4-dehydrorhamnose reductase